MVAARQELTKAEFAEIDKPGRHDLVDGELWSSPPAKIPHGRFVFRITGALSAYLESHGGGEGFGGELAFELDETGRTIFCPDVSFLRTERVPGPEERDFYLGAPDLAVEVISESERPKQVQTKVARYLSAGTRLVWCIYPAQNQIVVYSDEEPPQILGFNDVLDGRDVLPGFSLSLAKLFA